MEGGRGYAPVGLYKALEVPQRDRVADQIADAAHLEEMCGGSESVGIWFMFTAHLSPFPSLSVPPLTSPALSPPPSSAPLTVLGAPCTAPLQSAPPSPSLPSPSLTPPPHHCVWCTSVPFPPTTWPLTLSPALSLPDPPHHCVGCASGQHLHNLRLHVRVTNSHHHQPPPLACRYAMPGIVYSATRPCGGLAAREGAAIVPWRGWYGCPPTASHASVNPHRQAHVVKTLQVSSFWVRPIRIRIRPPGGVGCQSECGEDSRTYTLNAFQVTIRRNRHTRDFAFALLSLGLRGDFLHLPEVLNVHFSRSTSSCGQWRMQSHIMC